MTSGGRLAVYLRLSGLSSALDSPGVRLGALAQTSLEHAGARVLRSTEAGPPTKPRDDAFAWTAQHDRFLLDLLGDVRCPDLEGGGVVVTDDVRTVATDDFDVPSLNGAPVLWAAPASHLLDLAARPPAALTLTTADADALAAAGIRSTSLLVWSRSATAPRPVRRVVVAVGAGGVSQVAALADALASGLPGRPVIDVLPDEPLSLGGRRLAPLHPWARSSLARSCDVLMVLGRSAGTDLLAAEAAAAGGRVHRIVADGTPPAAESSDAGPLDRALPRGWGLAPIDAAARAESLHVPVRSLAGWLVEVSGMRDEER